MTYIIIGIVMVVLAGYLFIRSEDKSQATHVSKPVIDDDDPLGIRGKFK